MSQRTLHWSFTGWIARFFAPADLRTLRALRKPSEKMPKGTWLKSQSLSTLTLEGGAATRPQLHITLAGRSFLHCALGSGCFTYALVPASTSGLIFLGCFLHQYKPCKFCFKFETSKSASQCKVALQEIQSHLPQTAIQIDDTDKLSAQGTTNIQVQEELTNPMVHGLGPSHPSCAANAAVSAGTYAPKVQWHASTTSFTDSNPI
ncbi:hypothetical protein WJX74_009838 [Apatococcus lobatus]|uniref:Uncharacterized protein n=1 Tax=Apatococcus lobatus TaxID=904363 RepID=A0AAW1Q7W7_9CHLO